MLIESIRLQNFLSFNAAAPAIDPRPLNILIGPNGSGKSNFLEAFEILRNAPADILKPIRKNGGFWNWLYKKRSLLWRSQDKYQLFSDTTPRSGKYKSLF